MCTGTGKHMIASCDLEPGDLIFSESALLVVPKSNKFCLACNVDHNADTESLKPHHSKAKGCSTFKKKYAAVHKVFV